MLMMLMATEHQRIISSPLICVHDGAAPHFLHRLGHETLSRDIFYDTHREPPSPLKDPIHNGLATCTSPIISSPLSSEAGFICF